MDGLLFTRFKEGVQVPVGNALDSLLNRFHCLPSLLYQRGFPVVSGSESVSFAAQKVTVRSARGRTREDSRPLIRATDYVESLEAVRQAQGKKVPFLFTVSHVRI